MALKKFTKDPSAVLDYTVDWSEWLAPGDTIVEASATVSPSGNLTADTVNHSVTETTVWVSGGVVGVSYEVAIHIVTNGGREDDRTIVIVVKNL